MRGYQAGAGYPLVHNGALLWGARGRLQTYRRLLDARQAPWPWSGRASGGLSRLGSKMGRGAGRRACRPSRAMAGGEDIAMIEVGCSMRNVCNPGNW